MKRFLIFIYGVLGYLLFFGTFLYWIGFVGNLWVPKSVDSGQAVPLMQGLVVDLALIALFGLQHSIMARKPFKQWLTRFIPKSMMRSTYVIISSAVLLFLFWQWQPLELNIWHFGDQSAQIAMFALFGAGWIVLLVSTYLINHFELFGLNQVYDQLRNRQFQSPQFQTPLFYKIVRHPMMVGLIIAQWATPSMTIGHLIFAAGMTGYILVGLYYEERDLVRAFGKRYEMYQEEVPKLIPAFRRKSRSRQPVEAN